jgi:site-specific recombinase XerD
MNSERLVEVLEGMNELSSHIEYEPVEDLIYEFLRDRTPLTEKSYQKDLQAFFKFTKDYFNLPRFEKSRCYFEEIKRVHIVKYKKYLETNNSSRGLPFAPNTINRKISAVSSFFQFLLRREIVSKNPAEFCIRPKRQVVRETQAFTDREMKNLFDIVIEEAPPLHKAVVLLIFTTGMRQAELRNIKRDDFLEREGIRFLSYMGKGQKKNQVPIHPTAGHYIDSYIEWMEGIGRKIEKEDYLFQPTKNSYNGEIKKKLSHTALGYIIGKWAKKVNKDKRITPHSARATFISSLIENGEDIYFVSQLVNHSDVRTTQTYNKRSRSYRKNPIFNLNFF